MKLQCSCGTKYAFALTPQMARAPITFVCQQCGADSSPMVNQLIQRELGLTAPLASAATPPSSLVAPPPTREAVLARVHALAADLTAGASGTQDTSPAGGPAPLRVTVQKGHATREVAPATDDSQI